jgi:hypothetical protein
MTSYIETSLVGTQFSFKQLIGEKVVNHSSTGRVVYPEQQARLLTFPAGITP